MVLMVIQLLIVLLALWVGSRYGSLALGAISGIGLASLVFAGFDNAMLSLLMGLSPSHTRTRKTRLLNKIRKGAGRQKDYYERYFGNK